MTEGTSLPCYLACRLLTYRFSAHQHMQYWRETGCMQLIHQTDCDLLLISMYFTFKLSDCRPNLDIKHNFVSIRLPMNSSEHAEDFSSK